MSYLAMLMRPKLSWHIFSQFASLFKLLWRCLASFLILFTFSCQFVSNSTLQMGPNSFGCPSVHFATSFTVTDGCDLVFSWLILPPSTLEGWLRLGSGGPQFLVGLLRANYHSLRRCCWFLQNVRDPYWNFHLLQGVGNPWICEDHFISHVIRVLAL